VFVFAFLGMRGENGGREEEVREGQAFFCKIKRQLRSYIRGSGWFYAPFVLCKTVSSSHGGFFLAILFPQAAQNCWLGWLLGNENLFLCGNNYYYIRKRKLTDR